VGLNTVLGYIVVITLCFTMTDTAALLSSSTGFPFIQLFYNATNSYVGTDIMTAIIVINLVSAVISEIATASRQIWSFARDDGFPFSNFLKKVSFPICRKHPPDVLLVGETTFLSPAEACLNYQLITNR